MSIISFFGWISLSILGNSMKSYVPTIIALGYSTAIYSYLMFYDDYFIELNISVPNSEWNTFNNLKDDKA